MCCVSISLYTMICASCEDPQLLIALLYHIRIHGGQHAQHGEMIRMGPIMRAIMSQILQRTTRIHPTFFI